MADILGDLERLEKLSLVSKVCTELENHLGVNDKDLAEFIIDLAEQNPSFEKFKKALLEASGEPFPDSFIANLLRIIQKMNPAMRQNTTNNNAATSSSSATDLDRLTEINGPMSGSNFKAVDVDIKRALCPALAMPNQILRASSSDDDDDDEDKKKRKAIKTEDQRDEKVKAKKEKEERVEMETKSSSSKSHKKSSKKRSKSRSRSRDRRRR